ncbi:glycosyltransferase [Ochrovirga pacifica]|uniref:glycosyltransferase n=1 Tax=Ochrovirga pacifica TaxID=1042376 RepID=UPI0002559DF8|nr:glycosyltransferase [Ochrovirga pacifica]
MIKVLINAYACSPGMGSEPGMAWNWCVNLATHCELHIITEGEFRDNIEEVLSTLPEGKNMHFYYNPLSEEVRKMCWNQGDWRFYKHYKRWQYKTYLLAETIVKKEGIKIVHQLNMIGFREPGFLWKLKDTSFVWGPVDAKESFPEAYLHGATQKTKIFIKLKNKITVWQLKNSKRVNTAVEKASLVLAASSNSQRTFYKYFGIQTPLLNETGCYEQTHELLDKSTKNTLDLLWVGKLDFRKQLSLAIQSVAKVANKNVQLHIVGGGDDQLYKSLAKELGVEKQCKFYGLIPHKEVQKMMQISDLFFFTSVAEGTPHVVLEAIGNNLPILCFDTCGHGDSVDNNVGIKISLTNPEKSVSEFSEIIKKLYQNRSVLEKMAMNCQKRQSELSWECKVNQVVSEYKKIMTIS